MSFVMMPPHVTVQPAAAAAASTAAPSADEGFSFSDLIDIVNPLQHIPVVSTLYRAITGDQIKTFPKIAGDTLFGGITGFVSSVADTIFQKITGKSVGDTVLGWVEDELSPSTKAPTAVASATTPATSSTVGAHMSFGDRLVSWVEDVFSPSEPATAVASTAPESGPVATAAPTPLGAAPVVVSPASLDTIVIPGQAALMIALGRKNIDQDLAARAASAYRSTLGVSDAAAAGALH